MWGPNSKARYKFGKVRWVLETKLKTRWGGRGQREMAWVSLGSLSGWQTEEVNGELLALGYHRSARLKTGLLKELGAYLLIY